MKHDLCAKTTQPSYVGLIDDILRFIGSETILGYSFVFVHAMLCPRDQSRRRCETVSFLHRTVSANVDYLIRPILEIQTPRSDIRRALIDDPVIRRMTGGLDYRQAFRTLYRVFLPALRLQRASIHAYNESNVGGDDKLRTNQYILAIS